MRRWLSITVLLGSACAGPGCGSTRPVAQVEPVVPAEDAGAPHPVDATPPEPPADAGEARAAPASDADLVVPPPVALEKVATPGCHVDSDCVLSTWTCSPCGSCPGTKSTAWLRISLEAAHQACAFEGEAGFKRRGYYACSPCPGPPPGFRDWTGVSCREGQCVAHGGSPEHGP